MKPEPKMICCTAVSQRDTDGVIHLMFEEKQRAESEGKRAICSSRIEKKLPYIPMATFGTNNEHKWCKRCGERIGIQVVENKGE